MDSEGRDVGVSESFDGSNDTEACNQLSEDNALNLQCDEIETTIKGNPFAYDEYIKLIGIRRKCGDKVKCRNARDRMSEHFPLTEEMWLSWLHDEIESCKSEHGLLEHQIMDLFQRALNDYISVAIWIEYAEFLERNADFSRVWEIIEKAIRDCGEHLSEGHKIWLTAIEYMGKHSGSELCGRSICVDDVKDIVARMLEIPLLFPEKIWEKLETVASSESFDICKHKERLEKERAKYINQCEAELSTADDKLNVYRNYLKLELDFKAPNSRIRTLYERAVRDCCLDEALWTEYVTWIKQSGQQHQNITVVDRALRNVPWSGAVWVSKLCLLMEDEGTSEERRGCMSKAVTSGIRFPHEYIKLWMIYLNGLHRDVKEAENEEDDDETASGLVASKLALFRDGCREAIEFLASFDGVTSEDLDHLFKYQASVEANFGHMDVARSIWGEILHPRCQPKLADWLELIHLERNHGDPKHVRKTFHKALTRLSEKDLPFLCSAFERYTMEVGTVDSVEKIDEVIQEFKLKHEEWKKQESLKESKFSKKSGKNENNKSAGNSSASSPKKQKTELKRKAEGHPSSGSSASKSARIDEDGFRIPAPKKTPELSNLEEQRKSESSEKKVFISNLDYNITVEDIIHFFDDVKTEIESVDLKKDKVGKSRGFAYVLLRSEETAKQLLGRDRSNFKGRPIFISPCQAEPEKRKPVFKYQSGGEEPNKLFISHLALEVTEDQLRQVYEKFGKIVSVRIVTYRNGHSKGIAYVEFDTPAAAKRGLMETDGKEILGKTIEVAISNPPRRKASEEKFEGGKKEGESSGDFVLPRKSFLAKKDGESSSGHASTFAVPRNNMPLQGRRPQRSFIPRSLQGVATTKSEVNGQPKAAMSNADFRTMLLQKK